MAPLDTGTDQQPSRAALIAARRQRVAELYPLDWTQQAIADELEVNIGTVHYDLAVLERDGLIQKRPPGAMISVSRRRYWQSEAGQQERLRRSEESRAAPPVQRICETCHEAFELPASAVRWQPGLFCSVACATAARGPERLELLQGGHQRWRADAAKSKAESGLLDLNGVIKALPRELRRSQAALSGHIAAGGLVPTPNESGLLLFTEDAVADYITWLREHPDGRLRRFNVATVAAAKFRGGWYLARFKTRAEFGRWNTEFSAAKGTKNGRPFELDAEAVARIRDMAARGKSQRTIAHSIGISRGQVRRVLASS